MDGLTIKSDGQGRLLVTVETTQRYTHVTQPALARIKSPLDNMQL